MLRCVHVERRCQPLASELNGKDTETKFRYFSRRRRFVTSELRALRAREAEADIDVERKWSLSQSGVFAGRLACALRRHASEKEQIHSHSWLPPIQSWQRKNPSNQLTQSLAKEDHADPCMACSSLEMKPEQQLRSRSSPTSEHQRLRKLPGRGSRGVKFRHGLAPGSEKVSDNDIVFRRYCTNRQEKFWSNLAHKQHHRGATTRRHAGNVALI